MSRWVWFAVFALLGLVLLVSGWLVPAHLRAVDVGILDLAGRKRPTLVDHGLVLVQEKNLGAAQMLLAAADSQGLPGREKLRVAVETLAGENPRLELLGCPEPRLGSLGAVMRAAGEEIKPEPFTLFVLRLEHREQVMELLQNSTRPVVQELLRARFLTNTVMFSPSQSASGQAMDAALAVTGLLLDGGRMTSGLGEAILRVAEVANRGGSSQALEQALLDVMSLGQRMNWGQLAAFIGQIDDTETLRLLSSVVRSGQDHLPIMFAAVRLSGNPKAVTGYLMQYSQTGVGDLGKSLRYGVGGVNELLSRNQRVYQPGLRGEAIKYDPFGAFYYFALEYCWLMPGLGLAAKWLLLLAGGFCLAASLHYQRGPVPVLEQPLQVRGFHFARELLFGLGLLVVILLVGEPFLSQESQKVEFPLRLRLPMVGSAATAASVSAVSSFMNNQLNLLTLLLFFVLQGLIYTACLLKLAEIRRQNVPARIKIKLLENEDHLFDAGLYLGFVGTIISLILVSMGVVKFSLMAAYSSTSFGIIFVSIFKIFNLRPLRRKLLLEAEAVYPQTAPAGAPSLATHS